MCVIRPQSIKAQPHKNKQACSAAALLRAAADARHWFEVPKGACQLMSPWRDFRLHEEMARQAIKSPVSAENTSLPSN